MLAGRHGRCHGPNVDTGPRSPRAGGALVAAAILIGVLAGIVFRQPSIGFLIGLGVGLMLLLAVWLVDRRRRD